MPSRRVSPDLDLATRQPQHGVAFRPASITARTAANIQLIMGISRKLAAAVAAAVAAGTALAGTAHADPRLLNGTYRGADGDPMAVWTITTNCGPAGCSGTVASNKGWTSPARLSGGRWTFNVTRPGAITCADGHIEPAVVSLSVDPVTLRGVITADSNYGCPGGTLTYTPFQLTGVS